MTPEVRLEPAAETAPAFAAFLSLPAKERYPRPDMSPQQLKAKIRKKRAATTPRDALAAIKEMGGIQPSAEVDALDLRQVRLHDLCRRELAAADLAPNLPGGQVTDIFVGHCFHLYVRHYFPVQVTTKGKLLNTLPAPRRRFGMLW